MCSFVRNTVAVLTLACSFVAHSAKASDTEHAWDIWHRPGVHALMRHAIAPGTGDPENFTIGDCSTQRHLYEIGRNQPRPIAARVRDAGIHWHVLLSTHWCRCVASSN